MPFTTDSDEQIKGRCVRPPRDKCAERCRWLGLRWLAAAHESRMWLKLNVIEEWHRLDDPEIEAVEALDRKGLPERKVPSIEAIASYWALRCLKCDVPARDCEFVLDGHAVYLTFCDDGEPACMRCGMFMGFTSHAIRHFHGKCRPCKFTDDDPECPCGAPAECQEYPRAKADKAHIVARWQADFGDAEDIAPEDIDKPANIALLCHECRQMAARLAQRQARDVEVGQ